MGSDARAELFWGIVFDDEDDLPESIDDLDCRIENEDQDRETPSPTDRTNMRSAEWEAWRERFTAWRADRCELGREGSYDEPGYYVAVTASMMTAEWGSPRAVDMPAVDPSWGPKLRAYCERLGLPWKEPKWWLTAFWG